MSMYTVRNPQPNPRPPKRSRTQNVRPYVAQANAAPARVPVSVPARPAARRQPARRPARRSGLNVTWFTIGMIAAPVFLLGVLAVIGVTGLLLLSNSGRLALVPTPLPPTPTRYVPPFGLALRLYDPVRDETIQWDVPPTTWSEWIAIPVTDTPLAGTAFPLDAAQVEAYISAHEAELGADRTINMQEAVAAAVNAAAGNVSSPIRIYHRERQHVVQPGETIISIAWDYGMPYPYLQEANPGVDALSVGQSITIPSPDVLLPLPVIAGKRIEVSISEQRVRVYENGALKWDWVASTGINSSPTWTGVYQVLSHEPSAYASNWDLWMPNFMGVYQPIPNADFVNGFHGFPTRGGSQLLWTNSLGTRVTYGCILLSNDNIAQLYNWAEEGVVVEITG